MTKSVSESAPAPTAVNRRVIRGIIAGCVAITLVSATFGFTLSLTALYAATLHLSGTQLTWAGDAIYVGSAVAVYPFGSLAERFGRRRLMVLASTLAVLGNLIAATADTAGLFETGEVILGVGAGGLAGTSLAVLKHATQTNRERAVGLAAYTTGLSLGSVGSGLLGAYLAEQHGSSYRAAFGAMAVVSFVALVVIVLVCEESRATTKSRLDVLGQALLFLTQAALMYAVIEGAALSWRSGSVISAFVVTVIAASAFVTVERRGGGMIDLALFRRPGFAVSSVAALLVFFTYSGCIFAYAVRVTVAQGHSPLFSAAGTALIGCVSAAFGIVIRYVLLRNGGIRALLGGGLVAFGLAGLWLAEVPVSHRGFTALLGFLILVGVAHASTMAGFTAGAVNAAKGEDGGMVSSSQGVLRSLGSPLGIAIMGSVIFAASKASLPGRLAGAGLPPSVHDATVNANNHGGVLAVLHSGLGATHPAVSQAATAALVGGINDGARICGVICLVLAPIAVLYVERVGRRGRPTPALVSDPVAPPTGVEVAVNRCEGRGRHDGCESMRWARRERNRGGVPWPRW